MNSIHLRQTVSALRRGGVIAYPTEAVWGLGADPWDQTACLRLLALKRRPWDKGLILVAADAGQLEPFIEVPSKNVWKRAALTWPGPNTWVFPCTERTPEWISGDQDSVAVRISAHAPVRALCQAFGGALVSTSANPSTRPPARSATQVRLYFRDALDALLPVGAATFYALTAVTARLFDDGVPTPLVNLYSTGAAAIGAIVLCLSTGGFTPIAANSAIPVPQARWKTDQYRAPSDNTSLLVITRDIGMRGGACTPILSINGKEIATIGPGERLEMHVNAGSHRLRASPNSNCGANPVETSVDIGEKTTANYRLGFIDRDIFFAPTE